MTRHQVVALLTFGAAALATPASAEITYLTQDRNVSAFVDVGESPDSDFAAAADFLPFNTGVTAYVENSYGDGFDYAHAGADQHSDLGPMGFCYSGSAYGGGTADQYFSSWAAGSYFSITFQVDEFTPFFLTGTIAEFRDKTPARVGPARLKAVEPLYFALSDESGILTELAGPGSLDFSGLFEPGVTYHMLGTLDLSGSNPGSSSFVGSFELITQAEVPEAGTTTAVALVGGLALWQWRRRCA